MYATSNNFYSGLYEWDFWRISYIVCHVLITLIGTCLLYSVTWYERNSSDFRCRTLINQILAHCFWINLIGCTLGRLAYLSFTLVGPLNDRCCDFIIFSGRFLYLAIAVELTMRQTVKFLYIFQWSHVVSLNDDFFATFLTLCNLVESAVVAFVSYFLGFHNEDLEFHICTGKTPLENINKTLNQLSRVKGQANITNKWFQLGASSDPVTMLTTIIFVLLVFLSWQIWCYSHKERIRALTVTMKRLFEMDQICLGSKVGVISTKNKPKSKVTLSEEKFQEAKSRIMGSGHTLIIILLSLAMLLTNYMFTSAVKKDIESINSGNTRILLYISKTFFQAIIFIIFPFAVILNNSKMQASLLKDLKEKKWFLIICKFFSYLLSRKKQNEIILIG